MFCKINLEHAIFCKKDITFAFHFNRPNMVLEFEDNKDCVVYKNLVENPEDRAAIKNFAKKFDKNIIGASVKLYQKLKSSPNASVYNKTVSDKNKIELKSGGKDKDSLILKLRIQLSYRKFFYFYGTNSEGEEEFCSKKNWVGQFDEILKVYIYEVNKHDYSKA